jgi:hypothetical protein
MGITVDLSNFSDRMDKLKGRAAELPKILMFETAILEEHSLKIHAPYRHGGLKSSIYPEVRSDVILVTPHVVYARRHEFEGKWKGYVERAKEGMDPLLQAALNARAQEYLEEGR